MLVKNVFTEFTKQEKLFELSIHYFYNGNKKKKKENESFKSIKVVK